MTDKVITGGQVVQDGTRFRRRRCDTCVWLVRGGPDDGTCPFTAGMTDAEIGMAEEGRCPRWSWRMAA